MTSSKYKVIWDERVKKDFKALDKKIAIEIVEKVTSYLVLDPLNLGKKLVGEYKEFYRYRYGDYRIIYQVHEKINTIEVVRVGHRSKVY